MARRNDGPIDLLPRERRRRWPWVVGTVVVVFALVVVVNAVHVEARPGVVSVTAPQVITMTVTGSGAANSVTVLDGTGESQHEDVPLPYSTTTPLAGARAVAIEGQNGPAG